MEAEVEVEVEVEMRVDSFEEVVKPWRSANESHIVRRLAVGVWES